MGFKIKIILRMNYLNEVKMVFSTVVHELPFNDKFTFYLKNYLFIKKII